MGIHSLFLSVPKLIKDKLPLLIIILGRAGVAFAGIITVKISTTLLKPDQLGSISQLTSVVNLFNISLLIPVAHFMTRGFLDWYDTNQLKSNSKEYLKYILLIAIISMVSIGILQYKWNIVNGFGVMAVVGLIGLNILVQPINAFGTSGFNLLGDRKRNVFFTNLTAWSSLLFSLLFFYFFKNSFSWTIGQTFGFLVGCSSLVLIWKRMSNLHQKNLPVHEHAIVFSRKKIFAFSWPFIITSILWWVQTQSYRFILDRIHGLSEVGLFSVAYSLAAMPIMMYESIIGQYLEPTFFGELKNQGREGQVKAWNKYASLFLPGIAITGIFVAVGTPFLAKVFLGEAYQLVAIKITIWAALIETMRASGSMMFQLGMAKVDNRKNIYPSIAGALLAPLGVYVFGRLDPLYGTIAGLLFAGLIVLIINIVLSFKVLPVRWPLKQIGKALLLVSPVAFFLPVIFYFFPKPGFVLSFSVLAFSGLYVAGILTYSLSGKGREQGI